MPAMEHDYKFYWYKCQTWYNEEMYEETKKVTIQVSHLTKVSDALQDEDIVMVNVHRELL